eukprot:jgi/Botrbrau1/11929/Bobra.0259s0018.1
MEDGSNKLFHPGRLPCADSCFVLGFGIILFALIAEAKGHSKLADPPRPRHTGFESSGNHSQGQSFPCSTYKVAMLFMTPGPMPHESLWTLWLKAAAGLVPLEDVKQYNCSKEHLRRVRSLCEPQASTNPLQGQHLFTVYIHPSPEYPPYPEGSIFFGREVAVRVPVSWGLHSQVVATRELIKAALGDPLNQKFVMLSESCIPLYGPHHCLPSAEDRAPQPDKCVQAHRGEMDNRFHQRKRGRKNSGSAVESDRSVGGLEPRTCRTCGGRRQLAQALRNCLQEHGGGGGPLSQHRVLHGGPAGGGKAAEGDGLPGPAALGGLDAQPPPRPPRRVRGGERDGPPHQDHALVRMRVRGGHQLDKGDVCAFKRDAEARARWTACILRNCCSTGAVCSRGSSCRRPPAPWRACFRTAAANFRFCPATGSELSRCKRRRGRRKKKTKTKNQKKK